MRGSMCLALGYSAQTAVLVGDLEIGEHLHQLAGAQLGQHLQLGGAHQAEPVERGMAQQLAVVGSQRPGDAHGALARHPPERPLPVLAEHEAVVPGEVLAAAAGRVRAR